MFMDISLQDSCNRISRDIPLWYIQVLLGISRDKQGYLCADLSDIQGYPSFSYLGESYPRLSSRMNTQNCLFQALECSNLAHSAIWISSWKLNFHPLWRPGLEATGRGKAPSQGAGFSVGKTTGWYKSGLVWSTLSILFHAKYQRDIPG